MIIPLGPHLILLKAKNKKLLSCKRLFSFSTSAPIFEILCYVSWRCSMTEQFPTMRLVVGETVLFWVMLGKRLCKQRRREGRGDMFSIKVSLCKTHMWGLRMKMSPSKPSVCSPWKVFMFLQE